MDSPNHCLNASGRAYSTRDWLDNHHAIKARLRGELIAKLPIFPGDHVVDLGCATGNWTMLLADRVGINGRVIGVDIDAEALAMAKERRRTHVLQNIIRFQEADIEHAQFDDSNLDVFLLFNVLSYCDDAESLVRRVKQHLRPGGRILIKDTDLQSDFFWPVPFDIYSNVMKYTMSGTSKLHAGNYNPFFARNIPSLLRGIPGIRVSTLSQSFSFFAPLSAEEQEYIRANAALLSTLAEQSGGKEAGDAWFALFHEENTKSILLSPDFMYSMNEFIFQVTVI